MLKAQVEDTLPTKAGVTQTPFALSVELCKNWPRTCFVCLVALRGKSVGLHRQQGHLCRAQVMHAKVKGSTALPQTWVLELSRPRYIAGAATLNFTAQVHPARFARVTRTGSRLQRHAKNWASARTTLAALASWICHTCHAQVGPACGTILL